MSINNQNKNKCVDDFVVAFNSYTRSNSCEIRCSMRLILRVIATTDTTHVKQDK